MRYVILLSISFFFISSCKKDKYTTKPQLKYEEVNTKMLNDGEVLIFKLSFTDAEGDVIDTLHIIQHEKTCVGSRGSRSVPIPEFPTTKNQKGEFRIKLGYNVQELVPIFTPRCGRNDTAIFKFVLQDKAKNKSDTAYSDPIIIVR